MGNIAENLLALQQTKDNFKTSFESKGVDLTDVPFTEYPNKLEDLKENLDTELTEQEELLNTLEADVNALSDKDPIAYKIINGTLEEYDNADYGLTDIQHYKFANFYNLGKVRLDESITKIGEYSFYQAGKDVENPDFEVNLNKINGGIGIHAFDNSALTKFKGKVSGNLSSYSFYFVKHCIEIDLDILSTVGQYAIYGIPNLKKLKIYWKTSANKLPAYNFYLIGYNRENPENNIFILDFREGGVFTELSTWALTGNSTYKNVYMRIFLPKTLKQVGTAALRYLDHHWVYFSSTTVPTINSSVFGDATNTKIYVPYSVINSYQTATNLVTHADYIYGWAEENTFAQDEVLPTTNDEGLTLTWYSDEELTVPVTSVADPSKIYYCVGV